MPFATCSSADITAEVAAGFAVCGRNVDAESAEDVVSDISSVLAVSELRPRVEALSGSDLSGNGVVWDDDAEITGVRSLSSGTVGSRADSLFWEFGASERDGDIEGVLTDP